MSRRTHNPTLLSQHSAKGDFCLLLHLVLPPGTALHHSVLSPPAPSACPPSAAQHRLTHTDALHSVFASPADLRGPGGKASRGHGCILQPPAS